MNRNKVITRYHDVEANSRITMEHLLRRTLVLQQIIQPKRYIHAICLVCLLCITTVQLKAQLMQDNHHFTKSDTLRGSLNANRTWWDVLRYEVSVQPDIEAKTIKGVCEILFKPDAVGSKTMQIDLQSPMQIDSIVYKNKSLPFAKADTNVWLVKLDIVKPKFKNEKVAILINQKVVIYYHGKPREAKMAPWDGGWIWKKDAQGRPWVSVAVQGLGASAWYPCKDHQSDEPDNGASLAITVPDTLVAVANGRLVSQKQEGKLMTYKWNVVNPINNYTLIPYIGKYVNFTDTLNGEKGKLDLSYWVLDYNLTKAKEHFKQVKLMLRAFEYWMGPYPFYEDSYKLVDAPHLGMEHQSAIAYGNKYLNGYLGSDRSGKTGWGKKWDFIIVHESGHEWFANNITTNDIADMWVHEGFTTYSETLFTEYYYGKQAANEYNHGQRMHVQNDKPVIGPYGVNEEGSGDMYDKAANMIHSIRLSLNNDTLFRKLLRGLSAQFYHKNVNTQDVEQYINKFTAYNYQKVFDQYLRTIQIPVLEYYFDQAGDFHYRYTNCVNGFNLPIWIPSGKKQIRILPGSDWQKIAVPAFAAEQLEQLYFVTVKKVTSR